MLIDGDALLVLALGAAGWGGDWLRADAWGAGGSGPDATATAVDVRARAVQPLAVAFEAERLLATFGEAIATGRLVVVFVASAAPLWSFSPGLLSLRAALQSHLAATLNASPAGARSRLAPSGEAGSAAAAAAEAAEVKMGSVAATSIDVPAPAGGVRRFAVAAPVPHYASPEFDALCLEVGAALLIMDDLVFLGAGTGGEGGAAWADAAAVRDARTSRTAQIASAMERNHLRVARLSAGSLEVSAAAGVRGQQSLGYYQTGPCDRRVLAAGEALAGAAALPGGIAAPGGPAAPPAGGAAAAAAAADAACDTLTEAALKAGARAAPAISAARTLPAPVAGALLAATAIGAIGSARSRGAPLTAGVEMAEAAATAVLRAAAGPLAAAHVALAADCSVRGVNSALARAAHRARSTGSVLDEADFLASSGDAVDGRVLVRCLADPTAALKDPVVNALFVALVEAAGHPAGTQPDASAALVAAAPGVSGVDLLAASRPIESALPDRVHDDADAPFRASTVEPLDMGRHAGSALARLVLGLSLGDADAAADQVRRLDLDGENENGAEGNDRVEEKRGAAPVAAAKSEVQSELDDWEHFSDKDEGKKDDGKSSDGGWEDMTSEGDGDAGAKSGPDHDDDDDENARPASPRGGAGLVGADGGPAQLHGAALNICLVDKIPRSHNQGQSDKTQMLAIEKIASSLVGVAGKNLSDIHKFQPAAPVLPWGEHEPPHVSRAARLAGRDERTELERDILKAAEDELKSIVRKTSSGRSAEYKLRDLETLPLRTLPGQLRLEALALEFGLEVDQIEAAKPGAARTSGRTPAAARALWAGLSLLQQVVSECCGAAPRAKAARRVYAGLLGGDILADSAKIIVREISKQGFRTLCGLLVDLMQELAELGQATGTPSAAADAAAESAAAAAAAAKKAKGKGGGKGIKGGKGGKKSEAVEEDTGPDVAEDSLLATSPDEATRRVAALLRGDAASAEETVRLQMADLGHLLPRSTGTAPDPHRRVLFHPDGWQRDLLDAIDRRQSALIVAPTSAGKSFICYYVISCLLRYCPQAPRAHKIPSLDWHKRQNRGCPMVVFVVPTKALAMQVMADLKAQFRGAPADEIVAGISNNDWRINEETCRVLVTVPEMLQKKLLNPRWGPVLNRRITYGIMDEVHTMDASYQRVLQLLCCPVLLLSATVGNQDELASWLCRLKDAGDDQDRHAARPEGEVDVVQVPSYQVVTRGADLTPEERSTLAYERGLDVEAVASMDGLRFVRTKLPDRWVQLEFQVYSPPNASVETPRLAPGPDGRAPTAGGDPGDLSEINPLSSYRAAQLARILRDKPMGLDEVSKDLAPRHVMQLHDAVRAEGLEAPGLADALLDKRDTGLLRLTRRDCRALGRRLLSGLVPGPGVRSDDRPGCGVDVLGKVLARLPACAPTVSGSEPGDPVRGCPQDEWIDAHLPGLLASLEKRALLPALIFVLAQRYIEDFPFMVVKRRLDTLSEARRKEVETREELAWDATRAFYGCISQRASRSADKETSYEDREDPEQAILGDAMNQAWQEVVRAEQGGVTGQIADIRNVLTPRALESYLRQALSKPGSTYWNLHAALMRGYGAHHGSLRYGYRTMVECLFRSRNLQVVFCTSSLAYGVNMPCRCTVVCGDSPYLTRQQFRQASGRAGRRGLDARGTCVFFGLSQSRIDSLLSGSLPPIRVPSATTGSVVVSALAMCDPSYSESAGAGRRAAGGAADPPAWLVRRARHLVVSPLLAEHDESIRDGARRQFAFTLEFLRVNRMLDASGHVSRGLLFVLYLWWKDPANFLLQHLCAPLLGGLGLVAGAGHVTQGGEAHPLLRRLVQPLESSAGARLRCYPAGDRRLPTQSVDSKQSFQAAGNVKVRRQRAGLVKREWWELNQKWRELNVVAKGQFGGPRLIQFVIDDPRLFAHLQATGELLPGIGIGTQQSPGPGGAPIRHAWLVVEGRTQQAGPARDCLLRTIRVLAFLVRRTSIAPAARERCRASVALGDTDVPRRLSLDEHFLQAGCAETKKDLEQLRETVRRHNAMVDAVYTRLLLTPDESKTVEDKADAAARLPLTSGRPCPASDPAAQAAEAEGHSISGAPMGDFVAMTGHPATFASVAHLRRKTDARTAAGVAPAALPHVARAEGDLDGFIPAFFHHHDIGALLEEHKIAHTDMDVYFIIKEVDEVLRALASGLGQLMGMFGLSWIEDPAQHWKVQAVLLLSFAQAEFSHAVENNKPATSKHGADWPTAPRGTQEAGAEGTGNNNAADEEERTTDDEDDED